MAWRRAGSARGYPRYAHTDGRHQQEHPELAELLGMLQQHSTVKYAAYRAAFKAFELQKQLHVPPIHLTAGVCSRHCLSISESSLTLEVCELEALLNDIYFAASKQQIFDGDVDRATELVLNILLNTFDSTRTTPIRVQSAKILLILLSADPYEDKWMALVETCADHNGCVSSRRLTSLLMQVACVAEYLGEGDAFGKQHVQSDVDRCFAKSAGMLGMSTRAVVTWAMTGSISTATNDGTNSLDNGGSVYARWLTALQHVHSSRNKPCAPGGAGVCSGCSGSLAQVLKFSCAKCKNMVVCEKCYLYDKDLTKFAGHKKTHFIQEVDGEPLSPECLGFFKDFKKFFICSKSVKPCKRRKPPPPPDIPVNSEGHGDAGIEGKANGKPAMFTSTVGKASGAGNSPELMLQDIIMQLEAQNRALKDLSGQLDSGADSLDDKLRHKVDTHWGQIATQINRLKILKENLTVPAEAATSPPDNRIQAFDLFSPIPMLQEEQKQSKLTDNLKNQPRVLSLDSGNFSDVSKPSHDALMTVSGEHIKPVVAHATSDSISTVSMNDISNWFGNDADSIAERKIRQSNSSHVKIVEPPKLRSNSLCVTEQRYDADLKTVATSNNKMKELNADLDTVLDRLQQILSNNFVLDDSCFDNTQLRETANEMEGLLGTLIRGVEQRTTLNKSKSSAV